MGFQCAKPKITVFLGWNFSKMTGLAEPQSWGYRDNFRRKFVLRELDIESF